VPVTQSKPRVRDPLHTRAAIVQATIDALAEVGHAGTTTVEVQRLAGVSRGALLHHFGSRAELLAAAVDEIGRRRHEEMISAHTKLGDRVVNLDEALVMLRRSFSSITYCVEQELWSAARTDTELRRSVQPVEQRLGRQMKAGLDRLFRVVPEADREAVIKMAVTFVRGLAVADSLRSRPTSSAVELGAIARLLQAQYIDA
jgi:AcrR family transcriptional regulator